MVVGKMYSNLSNVTNPFPVVNEIRAQMSIYFRI